MSKKGATESFPFDETTLVFKVMNKMFAITDLEDEFSVVLKCEAENLMDLREQYAAIQQPRYFRGNWNLVIIDGSIDVKLITEWIDVSYALIVGNLPKKDRKALEEL